MTKILLVEDNEMNQDMLTRRLLRRGYEVVCAMDGQTGVDMGHSAHPDLILMDMSLPIMDGWEATRRLKADAKTRSIPIIALTAHAMVGDRQKSMDAGCDDYDTKPVELARLLSKIETLLAASIGGELAPTPPLAHQESVVPAVATTIPQQTTPPANPTAIRTIDPTAATILIVDDIDTNRDMLGRRLERAGYTPVLAAGGREALAIIEQQQIDLVLLDIMMPDFNGIETLQAIRANYSMAMLPVIMATAKDRSEDMLQAFELGANDYVTKPIDLPVVLARIQSHLRLIQSALQPQPAPVPPEITIPILNEPTAKSIEQSWLEIAEPTSQLLLGRYKIGQQLVQDNVRDIYLAQDTQQPHQPTCLVQRIPLDPELPVLSVAAIHQFKQEVEIFKQLDRYPQIASILDTVGQERQLCLVQEYIGTDLLGKKLKLERSAGIANALMTIVEISEILQKLHQYQLFHQHLDANCFAYNLDRKLVLIDLGIATRLAVKLHQIESNSPNIYQMPLDWSDRSAISLDIYSVGAIAIHALTGTPPDRISIDPVTGNINWRDLSIVATGFAKIIDKTICKNPDDRYQSIDSVLEDLYRLPMVSILLKHKQVLV